MTQYLKYNEILFLLGTRSSEFYIDTTNLKQIDLEQLLIKSELDVRGKIRDEKVEKFMNPPSFVAIFYYYIYEFQKVPIQQEYRSFYFLINKEWIGNNITSDLLPAFEGRVARTYPSLFRDIHFYFLLKESMNFKRVIYKMKYDLKGKVDVFVESFNNNWFGIQLRLDTKNSNYFAKYKKPYRDAIEISALKSIIDLPLNLSNARCIETKKDDLKVYSNKELLFLIDRIEEIEK